MDAMALRFMMSLSDVASVLLTIFNKLSEPISNARSQHANTFGAEHEIKMSL